MHPEPGVPAATPVQGSRAYVAARFQLALVAETKRKLRYIKDGDGSMFRAAPLSRSRLLKITDAINVLEAYADELGDVCDKMSEQERRDAK